MGAIWLTSFALFFRPEDSSWLSEEKCTHVPVFRFVNEKSHAPLKALVWTMISIIAGLIIGQLS
jgi:hypothetical protein